MLVSGTIWNNLLLILVCLINGIVLPLLKLLHILSCLVLRHILLDLNHIHAIHQQISVVCLWIFTQLFNKESPLLFDLFTRQEEVLVALLLSLSNRRMRAQMNILYVIDSHRICWTVEAGRHIWVLLVIAMRAKVHIKMNV